MFFYFWDTSSYLLTDIWQDKFKRISYFCITLHYIDRTKVELVGCWRKKDNVYLRHIIDEKLADYGLAECKDDLVFVSYQGGNIRVALKDL